LALHATARVPSLDFLVLWEPIAAGVAYVDQELRKKLMKEMVTFGKSRDTRESLLAALAAGGEIDFDGYAITGRLYNGLQSLDATVISVPPQTKTLLISVNHRDSLSTDAAKVQKNLTATGVQVDTRVFVAKPFWNLVGYADCSGLFRVTAEGLGAR
jgi:hypothetical protein